MSATRRGERRPVDEAANFWTHAVGFLLSLAASLVLLRELDKLSDARLFRAGLLYCCSLTGLYMASTLSHAFHDVSWRRFFRMTDQAFIFILIAGSYTPFAIVYNPEQWFSPLLAAEWAIAFAGVALCLYYKNLPSPMKLIYGVQGWLPVLTIGTIMEAGPDGLIHWLIAGGLFYTLGALFLILDRKVNYFHAIWHMFVMAGSACHYVGIRMIVAGSPG